MATNDLRMTIHGLRLVTGFFALESFKNSAALMFASCH